MKKYFQPEINISKLAFEANITTSDLMDNPEGGNGVNTPIVPAGSNE